MVEDIYLSFEVFGLFAQCLSLNILLKKKFYVALRCYQVMEKYSFLPQQGANTSIHASICCQTSIVFLIHTLLMVIDGS